MQQLNLVSTEAVQDQTTRASNDEALGLIQLNGSIERVIYFNDETGQCVLDINSDELETHFLITGFLPSVFPGQHIESQVKLSNLQRKSFLENGKVEDILQARSLKTFLPRSSRTLKKFLKSEAFSNLGSSLAMALAKAFPENFFAVLQNTPHLLLEVPGVGKKRLTQIQNLWSDFKTKSKLEKFLFSHNLPVKWARSIWAFLGNDSLRFFQEHPYQAATKFNFDFETVDAFALQTGFSLDLPERVRSGLYDILQSYYRQGHCAYPENRLLEEAQARLGVSVDKIEEILELEMISENLISDEISGKACVYLKEIWQLEKEVARKLLSFQDKEPPWGWFNSQKVLSWAQNLLQIQLAPLQKQAIEVALNSSLTVITGGPGTGKTTLIRSLVTILQTQFMKFALCSPTGRAAQRLDEATGAPAKTIHRLLKYNSETGLFTYNRNNPLDLDLVLIDEASMIDLSLMSYLLDALPERCALIFVGDADQIPPVGAGNILQSIIESKRFSTVRLTDIFRQSEKSLIKTNAKRINSGEMPITKADGPSDFHYLEVQNAEEAKRTILNLVTKVIPDECGIKDPSQFQILVPLNKGPMGTLQLNEELQKYITVRNQEAHSDMNQNSVVGFGQTFRTGDKVMVIKNDYSKDVFNGDIGFIQNIDHFGQAIDVHFEQRNIRFRFDELDRLTLAFAISIHKSQGSEYRAVIVVITNDHLPMAQRHLIYTAVTRGKEHVFLVAEPAALQTAILSDENNRRWQKLTELLAH